MRFYCELEIAISIQFGQSPHSLLLIYRRVRSHYVISYYLQYLELSAIAKQSKSTPLSLSRPTQELQTPPPLILMPLLQLSSVAAAPSRAQRIGSKCLHPTVRAEEVRLGRTHPNAPQDSSSTSHPCGSPPEERS